MSVRIESVPSEPLSADSKRSVIALQDLGSIKAKRSIRYSNLIPAGSFPRIAGIYPNKPKAKWLLVLAAMSLVNAKTVINSGRRWQRNTASIRRNTYNPSPASRKNIMKMSSQPTLPKKTM
jgi:hypothetical protein